MTITIDAELEARLRAKAALLGEDPNRYAVAVLTEALEQNGDLDADLSDEDKAAIRAGVERGLKAFEEGQYRRAEEFYADMSRKHGLPR